MRRMPLNAEELEKFTFINGKFGLTDEVLENVSKDSEYCKIVKAFNANKPVIVYDESNVELTIGTVNQNVMNLSNLKNNSGTNYQLTYDKANDKLTIVSATENFISEDNLKTIFGEQSLIGTGNIDLYMHELVISHQPADSTEVKYEVYLTYYSSSSLKIDSVQDLTTLIKPSVGKKLYGVVLVTRPGEPSEFSTGLVGIVYQSTIGGNVWQVLAANDSTSDIYINSISDTVTPL